MVKQRLCKIHASFADFQQDARDDYQTNLGEDTTVGNLTKSNL